MKTKSKYITGYFILVMSVVLPLMFLAPNVSAATFEVDSTLDSSDDTPGDGFCDEGSGDCTLRAAIEEANALSGADAIDFGIAGSGVHTIAPSTSLPDITEALTIDGSTESGASCGNLVPDILPGSSNTPHTLLIELDGSNMPNDFMLRVDGAASETGVVVMRGFVINGLDGGQAIVVSDFDDDDSLTSLVDCDYIGTNTAGNTAAGNDIGVYSTTEDHSIEITNSLLSGNGDTAVFSTDGEVDVTGSLIGTDSTGESSIENGEFVDDFGAITANDATELRVRNSVIAGNNGTGIWSENSNVTIEGNYIGVSLSGEPLGNGNDGIVIGGSAGELNIGTNNDGNVISANDGDGIRTYNDCSVGSSINGGFIRDNMVGTDINGEVASGYGNQENGIHIYEWSGSCGTIADMQIGGPNAAHKNVIAGNEGDGVLLHQSPDTDVRDIAIIGNSIHGNGGLGINLAADTNDDGQADTDLLVNALNSFEVANPNSRANSYVNYPEINDVEYSDDELTVNYDLRANQSDGSVEIVGYRLDFYVSPVKDETNHGEGATHIGSFIVDGSVDDGEHTFASPVELDDSMYLSATTTILKEAP